MDPSKMVPLALMLSILVMYISMASSSEEWRSPSPPPKHYNIVLFGATGDLAQKYLWCGLFALFSKEFIKGKVHFTIYGVGRTSQSDGRKIIGDILLKAIKCYDDDCRKVKTEFVQAVQYHALKTDKDYKALADKIGENTLSQYGLQENQTSYESGRLFYMSIPPGVVTKTVKRIRDQLLPREGRPWVRIVLEKPFGKDKKSAQKLATKLSELFTDDQIYRVDHYLGKPIVKLILPFRYINRELYEPLWNRHHVERVEVVMKEALDCKGRIDFYNDVGVVRDVMQNHLTELMLLVAMDLPKNSGNITEILEKKLEVMRQVRPLHKDGVLFGQYTEYKDSVREELEKVDQDSTTPTFSAAALHIDSPRWQGVPFVLMSGKQLGEKSSYVRVIFKDKSFCVQFSGMQCKGGNQVVFDIASDSLVRPPLVLVSHGLPKPLDSPIWGHENLNLDVSVFGESMSSMYKLLPASTDDAYSSLLIGAFNGERHLFTTTDILMASWDIWTPVLQRPITPEQLRMYDLKSGIADLSFEVNGRKLEFEIPNHPSKGEGQEQASGETLSNTKSFLNHPMVTGVTDEVIGKLATDILVAATRAVAEHGAFHLAVSGGNSPISLLNHLANLDEEENFPWKQTHVWQVDERCVSSNSVHSNFAALNSYLLSRVPVPYHHVHPMHVDLWEEPCQDGNQAAEFYETALKQHLPSGEFDFIVLGLGTDGHTASLFPGQDSLEAKDKMVVFSEGGPSSMVPNRVTLTLEAINKAREIGVFVTGASKNKILKALQEANEANTADYPILGVQPISGNLTFYIDQAAMD